MAPFSPKFKISHRTKWKDSAPELQIVLDYDMAGFDSRLAAKGQHGRLVWNIWTDRHTVLNHAEMVSADTDTPIMALGLIFEPGKMPRTMGE